MFGRFKFLLFLSHCSPVAEGSPKYTCLCADGYKQNDDKKTCTFIPIPTTVAPAIVAEHHKKVVSADDGSLSVGTIAAIASSIVLIICISIALVSYI